MPTSLYMVTALCGSRWNSTAASRCTVIPSLEGTSSDMATICVCSENLMTLEKGFKKCHPESSTLSLTLPKVSTTHTWPAGITTTKPNKKGMHTNTTITSITSITTHLNTFFGNPGSFIKLSLHTI